MTRLTALTALTPALRATGAQSRESNGVVGELPREIADRRMRHGEISLTKVAANNASGRTREGDQFFVCV